MNIFVIVIVIIILVYLFNQMARTETFDVLLTHNSSIAKVDLKNFFQFIEYYQINDLDPNPKPQNIYLSDEVEQNSLRDYIKKILIRLKSISHGGDYYVYDHYSGHVINTDLNFIKTLLQQDSDSSVFLKIYIMRILATDAYKRYIYEHKHAVKYRGIVFNPYMIDI